VDTDDLQVLGGDGEVEYRPSPRGDQSRYYAAIRDALLGCGENTVTPTEAVAVMAVLEAAVTSAREGRIVVPDA
jgi:predicted dehydrogenase